MNPISAFMCRSEDHAISWGELLATPCMTDIFDQIFGKELDSNFSSTKEATTLLKEATTRHTTILKSHFSNLPELICSA